MREKRSSGEAFVLAALLGLAAVQLWLIATIDASFALASCSYGFSLFADSAQCRWPAIEVAVGWVLFTGALASGWIGGVRVFNNRVLAGAQRKAGNQAAALPAEQLQRATMGAGHPLHDS